MEMGLGSRLTITVWISLFLCLPCSILLPLSLYPSIKLSFLLCFSPSDTTGLVCHPKPEDENPQEGNMEDMEEDKEDHGHNEEHSIFPIPKKHYPIVIICVSFLMLFSILMCWYEFFSSSFFCFALSSLFPFFPPAANAPLLKSPMKKTLSPKWNNFTLFLKKVNHKNLTVMMILLLEMLRRWMRTKL